MNKYSIPVVICGLIFSGFILFLGSTVKTRHEKTIVYDSDMNLIRESMRTIPANMYEHVFWVVVVMIVFGLLGMGVGWWISELWKKLEGYNG